MSVFTFDLTCKGCCESAALSMPANLENPAVATGLGKVRFLSNPKEGQCQRMLKLLHNCTHLTCWQTNAQNSPSQAQQYVKCEVPDVQAGFRKGSETNQIANMCWIIEKAREFQKNIYFCFIYFAKAFDCVDQKLWKFFKRWDHLTCLLRNLYAGQEATVSPEQRTGSK